MWAASAGTIAYCSAKVRSEADDRKVPLMGVLGAFLFAAQMINFSIPATGSSGHLGGGLLLTILLGPYAAFLSVSSVLVVQSLFFADGGLLALGCNIFNMGFIPAFLVYPLFYRNVLGKNPSQARLTATTIAAAIIGLQLGPFCVAMETSLSGISSLPFSTFVLLMQPIHLAIGIVEGFVTVAIVSFVRKARPDIIDGVLAGQPINRQPLRNVVVAFLAVALIAGGIVSRFASKDPDGLDWAVAKITGAEDLKGPGNGVHGALASLQGRLAFLPDYNFKKSEVGGSEQATAAGKKEEGKLGTSVSGILGSVLTLAIVSLIGLLMTRRNRTAS